MLVRRLLTFQKEWKKGGHEMNNNDYTKNSFWVFKDTEGNSQHYIKINDVMVPVSADVYKVCKYSYDKALRDNKRDASLLSLDKMNRNEHTLYDCLIMNDDEDKEVLLLIKEKISALDKPIRIVLVKYFYEQKTIREIANEISVSKSTVSNRLREGIKILKNFIKIWTNNN